ncbi:MAG: hypothetical protein ACFFAS_05175 [Promethearchaeota archaeon]
MQEIKNWFRKARLSIKITKDPIGTRNRDVFQMSIATIGKKRKRETFRMFLGHEENDVRVIDANSKYQQVILLVKEPARDFQVRVYDSKIRKFVLETRTSPEGIRKFLMGMDESHLFIATLPDDLGAINKVKDAHRILKPEIVLKEEKNTNRIKRQGEWFFIPASTKELEEIKKEMEKEINTYLKKAGVGSMRLIKDKPGRAHIADEIIKIPNGKFVRGKISHRDHKTIKLHGWHMVSRNTEGKIKQTSTRIATYVVGWVD